jgi:hypothetical protein
MNIPALDVWGKTEQQHSGDLNTSFITMHNTELFLSVWNHGREYSWANVELFS